MTSLRFWNLECHKTCFKFPHWTTNKTNMFYIRQVDIVFEPLLHVDLVRKTSADKFKHNGCWGPGPIHEKKTTRSLLHNYIWKSNEISTTLNNLRCKQPNCHKTNYLLFPIRLKYLLCFIQNVFTTCQHLHGNFGNDFVHTHTKIKPLDMATQMHNNGT